MKSNAPSAQLEVRAFSSFFAEQVTHYLDAFPARFSVLRPRENSRVDDNRLYRSKPGIQYVLLLIFNASCIHRHRLPVEMTPSGTAPEGLGLVGPGPRYKSEVRADLNDISAGDPPINRIFGQNTAIPNHVKVLSAGRMTPPQRDTP